MKYIFLIKILRTVIFTFCLIYKNTNHEFRIFPDYPDGAIYQKTIHFPRLNRKFTLEKPSIILLILI